MLQIVLLTLIPFALGCNYITVSTGDGNQIVGRDMQFSTKPFMPTRINTFPVGSPVIGTSSFDATGRNGTIGATYGYIGTTGFDVYDVNDGMNTEGLQCSALYLPDYAGFQTKPPNATNVVTVFNPYFCNFILATQGNVSQVNATLTGNQTFVVSYPILEQPLHYAITDRFGNAIIVEYLLPDGKLYIYKNFVGIMTNSPPYEWHLKNLAQYSYLNPNNTPSTNYNGLEMKPTGDWGQFIGLPGGSDGQSRFVRLAISLHWAEQAQFVADTKKAIPQIQHLINIGEVTNGTLDNASNKSIHADISQWATMYDLKNRVFYWRSYDNFLWKQIQMSGLNLSLGNKGSSISVYQGVAPQDFTSALNDPSGNKTSGVFKRSGKSNAFSLTSPVYMVMFMVLVLCVV